MSIRVQTLARSAISGLSMLLACFLALAYFVVSQGVSQAATVNDIVKDVKLSGVSSSTKLGVGTMMQVDFTIDGTGKAIRQGDTFTIQAPPELNTFASTGTQLQFDMIAPDGQVAVNCSAPAPEPGAVITCTFTDYANSHQNITGSGWAKMSAAAKTTAGAVSFLIDGKAVSVPLPGDGTGIGDTNIGKTTKHNKGGTVDSDDPSLINWSINIVESGISVETITVDDTFTNDNGGYTLANEPSMSVWANGDDFPLGDSTTVSNGDALNGGTFTVTKKADGSGFTATWPKGNGNAIYSISYNTKIKNPAMVGKSATFTNNASVNAVALVGKAVITADGGGSTDDNPSLPRPTPSTTTPAPTPSTTTPAPTPSTTTPAPTPSTTTPAPTPSTTTPAPTPSTTTPAPTPSTTTPAPTPSTTTPAPTPSTTTPAPTPSTTTPASTPTTTEPTPEVSTTTPQPAASTSSTTPPVTPETSNPPLPPAPQQDLPPAAPSPKEANRSLASTGTDATLAAAAALSAAIAGGVLVARTRREQE
ncbi:Ig-like domain-containing protein [uncultured Actinomyces sp.]|uniref:Ig-like domain-containing protein n=1 Tax=uncultured Actinomyces sp. TaxID=249061 RepID=UPI0028D71F25|nr:Ig-like domain-containing protein [uncultured Actinomyces sp.]